MASKPVPSHSTYVCSRCRALSEALSSVAGIDETRAGREYLLHLKNDNHDAPNTILMNRSALRFLYRETLKQKWFDEEIAHPKRRTTLPGILSPEEVTRILDHTTNLKHWTILATFYATGLRCNELCNLKVSDIDSERMVLHVREGERQHCA